MSRVLIRKPHAERMVDDALVCQMVYKEGRRVYIIPFSISLCRPPPPHPNRIIHGCIEYRLLQSNVITCCAHAHNITVWNLYSAEKKGKMEEEGCYIYTFDWNGWRRRLQSDTCTRLKLKLKKKNIQRENGYWRKSLKVRLSQGSDKGVAIEGKRNKKMGGVRKNRPCAGCWLTATPSTAQSAKNELIPQKGGNLIYV